MITTNTRRAEKGNVLFLILIAVALFAALSYVVTQSTRSGGGSTEREKNILSSASMTQYPTALRTAVTRMILSGVSMENLRFNDPTTFGSVPSTNTLVFHPQGGGAVFQEGPADLSVSGNQPLGWTFNLEYQVPQVGITEASNNVGNDLIAFLPGVSDGVCRQVNEELGINVSSCSLDNGVPESTLATATIDENFDHTYSIPSTTPTLSPTTCTTLFERQASGCFSDSTNRNVFFAVLLER